MKKVGFANQRRTASIAMVIAVVLIVSLGAGCVRETAQGRGPCPCPWAAGDPHGGGGGSAFSDDLTQTVRIAEISIRYSTYVDAIQTTWVSPSGSQILGARHGGEGGKETKITLEEDEYINRIEGKADKYVDSLTFYTSKGRKYGPYGGNGGTDFALTGLCVGGFVGRSEQYLDAFGVLSSAQ